MLRTLLLFAILFTLAPTARAGEKPISFIDDVAPILKENCFACHDSKKRFGKYDMSSFEKLMAGGAGGEQLVPGTPLDSEFYTLMVTDEPRRMPPRDKGEAVPKDKAAIVAAWIKQGAKLDAGISPTADLIKELRVRWKPPTPPMVYPYATIVNALTFTPDGKHLVVGGHHELTVWDVATGTLTKRLRTRAERAYSMAFIRDGKLAVAGGRPGQEGDVRIYDLAAAPSETIKGVQMLDGVNDRKVMLTQLVDSDDSILCLSASADGNRLVSGGCDRTVRVWDLSKGIMKPTLEQTIENHADWVLGVALTADGKHLLSAGRDKTAKVWDFAAKESILTFPEHQAIVYGVGAKADGSLGVSIGADQQLRLWKPTGEGKQLKNTGGHTNEIFKLALHPKEPIVVTASADKTVRSWNLDTLAAIKTFSGLTDYVYAVAISPDGQLVAGGAYDGEVRIWKLADASLVRAFNASPGFVRK